MTDFAVDRRALDRLVRSAAPFWRLVGNAVRDEARRNVDPMLSGIRSSNPGAAIIAVPGEDSESAYVDVGYDKHHPGFYLWWWEVGTRDVGARPHLRPALRPGLID